MAMILSLMVGFIFALFILAGWQGIDLLMGMDTLTAERGQGIILLSMCGWFGLAAIATMLWG